MSKNPADPRRSARRAGFTLIEVLVALAIAALGMGALIAAASQGLGNAAVADQYVEATRRAESRLAMATASGGPGVGEWSGDDGAGYAWRLRIAPAQVAPPAAKGAAALAVLDIDVTISWQSAGAPKSVQLQSQRIGHVEVAGE